MSTCVRCRTAITHRTPTRFQIRASDLADSNGTHHQGTLCIACWEDLIEFLGVGQIHDGGRP